MKLLERVHEQHIADRRVRVLCGHVAALLPPEGRVLDVGCGDGRLAWLMTQQRPDLELHGLDVLVRPGTLVPVKRFDGHVIPHGDASVDAVLLIDTLHHAEDPMGLLREAVRVARQAVVIKDHTREGLFAHSTLRFMDWVGNARYGVALPYRYWTRRQWDEAFGLLGWCLKVWKARLGLYPWPASVVFERSLHFIARLEPGAPPRLAAGEC